jgi:O-antigen/teichoic acid export membrane protein
MRVPKVITNTSLYSFASFLQKGIGFLLLPLYTHYLSPEDYGVLNVITSITGFLSILFTMSLHGAASRFHFNSEEKEYRAKVWGTILLLVLANSVFWGVLAIVFHPYLIDPFTKGIEFYPLVFLALLGTILSPLYMFYQQWLRNRQEGWRYSANLLCNFILAVTLNIVFLAVFNFGILSLIVSSLLVAIVFFIYSLIRFVPNISFKYDREIGVAAMKYSLPLVPHNITGYWSVMIDRLMLNTLMGASAVGLYSIGSQFGSIISIVAYSINLAYSPWCFQEMAKGENGNYQKLYMFADVATFICCFFALLISLFAPEVISLMTSDKFHDAWQPIPFICFGFVANGLYYFFCQPLFFAHTKYVMYVSIIALATAYFGNLWLIPVFGIIGTGISLFASMMVTAVLALVLSMWLEPQIKYHYVRMIAMTVMMLAVSLTVFEFQQMDDMLWRILSKAAVVIALCMVFTLIYRNQIKEFVKVIKKRD